MNETEKLNALRLMCTANIGPITYGLLLARYGSATNAISEVPKLGNRQGRSLKVAHKSVALKIIEETENAKAHIIIRGETDYPKRLLHFDDAPIALFAKGHLSLLKKDMVAIVGARNASTNAMTLTAGWAAEIGTAGYVIVSGLARGIDRAAHIGALETGTIGIIGCGIDIIYPKENEDLHEQMCQSGLIITELPPGTKPSPRNFPARNRIIASLAKGTLVVEAALKSGSLITAKESGERGADVMAIPGAPTDPRSHGTNQLIKEGAHLVTSSQDVLQILQSPIAEPSTPNPPLLPGGLKDIDETIIKEVAKKIMKMTTFEAVDIDELTRQCHVSANVIQVAILELEIAGYVQRLSGNRICKVYIHD